MTIIRSLVLTQNLFYYRMIIIVAVKHVFYDKISCYKGHQLNLSYDTCFTAGPHP